MLKLTIPVNPDGDVFEYELDKEKMTLGRRHDNDIRIKETYVSAYHAEFTRDSEGNYYLRDRDSSNGTYINGKRLKKRVRVSNGDRLKFGSLRSTVTLSSEDAEKITSREKDSPMVKRGEVPASENGSRNPDLALKSRNDPRPDEEEIQSLRTGLKKSRAELAKTKAELKAASSQVARLKKVAKEGDAGIESELNQLRDELTEKKNENEGLTAKLKETEKDYRSLAEELQLFEEENQNLREELSKEEGEIEKELKALQKQLSLSKNDNLVLKGLIDSLEADRDEQRLIQASRRQAP